MFMSQQIFNNCFATMEPKIDEDHLANYPNCGELPDTTKARISNAIPSPIRYPWAILVIRRFTGPNTNTLDCGGTIITKK